MTEYCNGMNCALNNIVLCAQQKHYPGFGIKDNFMRDFNESQWSGHNLFNFIALGLELQHKNVGRSLNPQDKEHNAYCSYRNKIYAQYWTVWRRGFTLSPCMIGLYSTPTLGSTGKNDFLGPFQQQIGYCQESILAKHLRFGIILRTSKINLPVRVFALDPVDRSSNPRVVCP